MKSTKFRDDNMRRRWIFSEQSRNLKFNVQPVNLLQDQLKNPTFCHQFMCSVLRWSSMLKKAWNTDNGQPRSSSLSSGYKKVFAAIIYNLHSWSWSPCRCSWSCCAPPGRRTGCPRCHGTQDTVLHSWYVFRLFAFSLIETGSALLDRRCIVISKVPVPLAHIHSFWLETTKASVLLLIVFAIRIPTWKCWVFIHQWAGAV